MPGGQIEAELINNWTGLLDSFKLQVVDLLSKAVAWSQGLLNFYQHNEFVLGVVEYFTQVS